MSGSCEWSIAIHNSPLRIYGTTRSSGTLPTDRTFTGQKQDSTGLLYFNARYYDPALGTFISPDTLVPDAGVLFDYNR
jgi:RHS repeat-associated protein